MTDTAPEAQAAMREWQAVTDDLVAITRAFDLARWDEPSACGDWTNRQLLAHMATGYGVRIAALQAVISGTAAPEIDADAANAGNVARMERASGDGDHRGDDAGAWAGAHAAIAAQGRASRR